MFWTVDVWRMETVDNQINHKCLWPHVGLYVHVYCRWEQFGSTPFMLCSLKQFHTTPRLISLVSMSSEALVSSEEAEVISRELQTKNKTENCCCKTSTTTGVVRKAFSSAHALLYTSSARRPSFSHAQSSSAAALIGARNWCTIAFDLIWICEGFKLERKHQITN